MKSQFIFLTSIFYIVSLYSEHDQQAKYTQSPHITIILNANTDAGADQNNTAHQKAQHTSSPCAHVAINDGNLPTSNKPLQEQKKLEPTTSETNFVIKNAVKLYGVYMMASQIAHAPFLFPAYAINRCIVYPCISDTPWLDEPTKEEAEELAQQGKYKRAEPIVYPIAHHLYKTIMNKFFK